MTTSGVTAYSMTARDFITAALEDTGVIPLGRTPKAKELEACLVRFNLMLKSLSVRANLWREATTTVTIPAGTGSYTLNAAVQDVTAVRHALTSTNARMLRRWERDEYRSLPNRAQAGNPSIFHIERTTSGLTLKVWPVPAANISAQVDYIRAAEAITDASETVDFREEFAEAIMVMLARRCCGIFGVEPTAEMIAREQVLERQMLDADRPESYYFEADCA